MSSKDRTGGCCQPYAAAPWTYLLIAAPIVRGKTGLLVGRLGQAGEKSGPLIFVPLSILQKANCAAIF